MKIKIDLADNFIDVWNEEKEIWERYVKVELEEEKKIPEKIDNWTSAVGRVDDSNIEEYVHKLFKQQTVLYFKFNSIIDYLEKEENNNEK